MSAPTRPLVERVPDRQTAALPRLAPSHVCLVTGASGGIGKEIARALARTGATVVLACRDAGRGAAARDELRADTGNASLHVLTVDLSRQDSIRHAAAEFRRTHARLHALVNNAAVVNPARTITPEGVEETWAVNVLAPFLLTALLLPALAAGHPARVVNLTSNYAGGLDLDDINFERRRYRGRLAYKQSKQAVRMITWELARRLTGTAVTANAVHPGFVRTSMVQDLRRAVARPTAAALRLAERFIGDARAGADAPAWLAAGTELAGVSGALFMRRRRARCPFRDPDRLEQLWTRCAAMTGLRT